jgi:hypothetical protein
MKNRLTILALVCLVCVLSISDQGSAHTCPTPVNDRKGPLPPSKFYYLGALNSLLQDPTRLAFDRWNNVLFSIPCAGLTFFESNSSTIDDPIHVENGTTLFGTVPANAAAQTLISGVDASGVPFGILIRYKYPSAQISSDPANIGTFESGL